MATVINEKKYIKSDVANNNNKFWYIKLFDDNSTEVTYGRVGDVGTVLNKVHPSSDAALKFFDSKCKEKEKGRNGEIPYKLINLISSNTTVVNNDKTSLEKIVESQIVTDSDETKSLIKFFLEQNIHNITSSTTITYDVDTGLFQTPCGAVTSETIKEARDILSKIEGMVNNDHIHCAEYDKIVGEYLMLIPHDVGRKFIATNVICNVEDVYKEYDILDSLQNTYEMIEAGKDNQIKSDEVAVDIPKVFDVQFKLLEDVSEINRIKNMFISTIDKSHSCSHLRPKRIFEVSVQSVNKAYEEGSKVGNIRELWHGSNVSNILSIMKSGLIIPPANASHCCGRMFGNGVYASDQSTKALNYAYGYWSGTRNEKCYMFVVDFAMGKEYNPKSYRETLPKAGYDSTFAKGGECGLRNNEMIVYNTNQVKLKYLVEFE